MTEAPKSLRLMAEHQLTRCRSVIAGTRVSGIREAATTISHRLHKCERKEDLVSVCAWCPPEIYKPLKLNQRYTHGICSIHKKALLEETARNKKVKTNV